MQTTLPNSTPNTSPMQSSTALWIGIAFSFVFTALIWWLGDRLAPVRATLAPDTGAAHYFWKLPDPTWITRASVWVLYFAHQFAAWGLIYYAQTRVKTYTSGLHPVNVWALGLNAVFIVLHMLQTHIFYDGLAQDVSIFSSQGSVIMLLVVVLIMENKRRGMFFGKPMPLSKYAVDFLRKYHGYLFSWAIIYTFWYHPTENTMGHLIGFLYMFLLMLQGSLFLTRVHVNRYWMFVQEFAVLLHGALVAWQQGNGIWPMFAFGFGGMFIITQMYGLGLSRNARFALILLYAGLVTWVYSGRGWGKLNEIIRIPVIEYLVVFVLTGLVAGILWIARKLRPAELTPA